MKSQPTRASLHSHPALAALSVALVSAAILLPGLGSTIINREQELRVVLTARDMVEGGSWLIPRYRGEVRLRKPPLMYWAVAACCKAAGTTHSLLVARLPSAMAGAGLALCVWGIGRVLIGRRNAWFAAIVAATSFIAFRQGRLAETDVPLSLLTAMAAGFGYVALRQPRPGRWWLLAGLAGGLGFMTKGPAALLLPPLAWIAFALTPPHRWRKFVSVSVLPGFVAFAAVALPWYLAVSRWAASTAENQIQSEITRTFTESHHDGPVYYYVYTLMHAMMPWSLLVPIAFVLAARRAWHHAGIRFVLLWFASSFAALSLISSKQIHYATLLVAPGSLLAGWLIGFGCSHVNSWRRRLARGYVASVLAVQGLAGLALLTGAFTPAAWPRPVTTYWGLLILLAAGAPLWLARRLETRIVATAAVLSLIIGGYAMFDDPRQRQHAVFPRFLRAAQTALDAAPRLFHAGPGGSILDFYSTRRLLHRETSDIAWAEAEPGDAIIVSGNNRRPPRTLDPPVMSMTNRDMVVSLLIKPRPPPP
jgi:4-amino-4-deoxy-L-arabinose transferase-like glycosyltransferase